MNTYPAGEQMISEVERGRCSEAVVPLLPGESLSVGDTVLFALSQSRAGLEPSYVKGGDSVLVTLTHVADLGKRDPATDQALLQLRWNPLGQSKPTVSAAKRIAKTPRSLRPA